MVAKHTQWYAMPETAFNVAEPLDTAKRIECIGAIRPQQGVTTYSGYNSLMSASPTYKYKSTTGRLRFELSPVVGGVVNGDVLLTSLFGVNTANSYTLGALGSEMLGVTLIEHLDNTSNGFNYIYSGVSPTSMKLYASLEGTPMLEFMLQGGKYDGAASVTLSNPVTVYDAYTPKFLIVDVDGTLLYVHEFSCTITAQYQRFGCLSDTEIVAASRVGGPRIVGQFKLEYTDLTMMSYFINRTQLPITVTIPTSPTSMVTLTMLACVLTDVRHEPDSEFGEYATIVTFEAIDTELCSTGVSPVTLSFT